MAAAQINMRAQSTGKWCARNLSHGWAVRDWGLARKAPWAFSREAAASQLKIVTSVYSNLLLHVRQFRFDVFAGKRTQSSADAFAHTAAHTCQQIARELAGTRLPSDVQLVRKCRCFFELRRTYANRGGMGYFCLPLRHFVNCPARTHR